jgi:hypothetical protein
MVAKRLAFAEGPRNERLFHLLRRVREGDILIPRFQRPFMWTDQQRLLLLDSIQRRMPIGGLVLWRTAAHELECFQTLGVVPIDADPERRRGKPKSYILDGHQRLITLYAELGEGLVTNEGGVPVERTKDELAGDERPTRLLYHLENERFIRSPAIGAQPALAVPLSILFDRFKLREFEHEISGMADGKRLVNRLGDLADVLRDYEVSITTLVTEDETLAMDALARLSPIGTPIDHVGMVSAAVWLDDIPVQTEIDLVLARLADEGWQALAAKTVFDATMALLDGGICPSEIEDFRRSLRSVDAFDQTAENLRRAARLLAVAGIHGPKTLPYDRQVILLALVLSVLSEPLLPKVQERLLHWFWFTTYSEAFADAANMGVQDTLEYLHYVALGKHEPLPSVAPSVVVPITRFDFRSARSRALAVAMSADLHPRRPDGQTLDALRLLAERGDDMIAPLFIRENDSSHDGGLATAAPRRAPENRIICHPTEANELRRMLTTGIDDCPPEVRWSHAIDDDVVAAWKEGGASAMLRTRRVRLLALERARVERLGLTYAPDPAV